MGTFVKVWDKVAADLDNDLKALTIISPVGKTKERLKELQIYFTEVIAIKEREEREWLAE